jgi:hypothetical protein
MNCPLQVAYHILSVAEANLLVKVKGITVGQPITNCFFGGCDSLFQVCRI